MYTPEQKEQFNEILEELGKSLDITEKQHEAAVKSYEYIGTWLAKPESTLAPYNPEIRPQGSFMLGTMIKPVNEDDELDIDLVCRLEGKHPEWAQCHLKNKVGDRIKANGILEPLLDEEGRRCWTLQYAESAKFHLDILPSLVDQGYKEIFEKAFAAVDFQDTDKLAIRITDREMQNYKTDTNPVNWMKSNPFGYARWFFNEAEIGLIQKSKMLSDSIQPVPKYQSEKLPLQRVVQILKRHRDIMFNGDEDKPISIIITTLAAKAYRKQTNILEALESVIAQMPNEIEERYDPKTGKWIKWIANPVNDEENFADKWPENPQKQKNFYDWIEKVRIDVSTGLAKRGGVQLIQEAFEKPFGKNTVQKAFSNYGENMRVKREKGNLKMAAGTGLLGSVGRTSIPGHTNFGKHE